MNTLYHASTNKDLTLLEPQRTLSKDKYIGDYVFATSDRSLAAMYLITRGTSILLNANSKTPRVIICAEPNEYIEQDKGGAIYTVSGDSFRKTPQEELEDSEMVSKVAVKPLSKIVYITSIDALKESGVEIYFVNKAQFDDIVLNKKESEVVATLTAYA